MKTYRSPSSVVAEVKRLIETDKPSPHAPSVLARVLKQLCDGRNYVRAGVFLSVDGKEVPRAFSGPPATSGQTGPELNVPIKIASHTLGSLRVQLAPGHEFSPEERVLLHEVAEILALYLSSKGKYLVRKAREALRESAAAVSGEARGYQPASDRSVETRRAAAGEKSRT